MTQSPCTQEWPWSSRRRARQRNTWNLGLARLRRVRGPRVWGFVSALVRGPPILFRGLISHRTLSILVCRLLCAIGWRVCACASQGFSKPQSLHHFLQPARCCEAFSKLASPSLPCELLLLEPQLMGADGRSKFSTFRASHRLNLNFVFLRSCRKYRVLRMEPKTSKDEAS